MSKRYEQAGVSLEAGYESVHRIAQHVKRTGAGMVGGFGGLYDLGGYQHPILVSGTDGVGTKLMLAFALNQHDTIGIDAVAMCVNDVIVQGAKPLFFLDYIAVGQNHPEVIEAIVSGVADGCVQSGAALIGGETAEMPGMYAPDHYDLAGFCVGAVEKEALIEPGMTQVGDVLIGIPSSGVHSNGFSLVRQILKDAQIDLQDPLLDSTVGQVLLTPTRIYVPEVMRVLEVLQPHGMAHVTGGGFYENLPRMLAKGQGIEIEKSQLRVLPVFDWLAQVGQLDFDEMCHVFNMGVGFVLAVAPQQVDQVLALIEDAYVLGRVTDQAGVVIR